MTILVDDAVWADVFAAASRYERERTSLGEEFVEAVDAALAAIALSPEAWAVWPDIRQDNPPIRRYVMPRFPYVIGFQVFAEHVQVIVIAYGARKPGYWR